MLVSTGNNNTEFKTNTNGVVTNMCVISPSINHLTAIFLYAAKYRTPLTHLCLASHKRTFANTVDPD